MPIYRFRILDETKHVIAGQYSHCNDDDAARRHADIFAAQARSPNIVIWDDDRQVLREHADPLPYKPTRPYDRALVSWRMRYERAKDHVECAEACLTRQNEIVQTLNEKGYDSREAERLLEVMTDSRWIMRRCLRTIEDEMLVIIELLESGDWEGCCTMSDHEARFTRAQHTTS